MDSGWSLQIGSFNLSLPSFSVQTIELGNTVDSQKTQAGLIGKPAPDFSLENSDGGKTSTVGLLGKPTVLSFSSSWVPTSSEQTEALSKLQANKDINVVVAAIGEKLARLKAYSAISGSNLIWTADPDSILMAGFNPQAQPTHLFIDRKGVIQKIISGVLSEKELTDNLSY